MAVCMGPGDILSSILGEWEVNMLNEILFYIVAFLSNIIMVITGFAGTMLAMPPSMLLIGVDEAKAILNVMGWLSCVWVVIRDYKYIDVKKFLKIIVIMFIGMVVGIQLFKIAPMNFLLTAYAILIILIALKKLFIQKEIKVPQSMMIIVLLVAGLVHGMFVSGGSFLVVYAVTVLSDKNEFRATVSAVWVLLNGYLMFDHFTQGFFTPDVIRMTLICIIPLAASVVIGNKLHDKINQQTFLKLTYILLLIAGIMLII